ncbi:MAG: hypothetical protein QOE05_1562, partial [Actinomycetota bacterium]|nr:hypothetical protein [Actinomycetota bacterium]
ATLAAVVTVTATTAAALPETPTTGAAYSDVMPGTIPDATVQVSGASDGPAAAGLPPVPTVLYYGDSIGYEAGGAFADILAASGRVKVEFRAFPATAVCDWLPDMRTRVAREKPKAIVVSFLGLGLPKCMHDASGRSPQGSALVRRTVQDARTALQVLTSTGATVYWNSTPASWTLPDQDRLTSAVREVVLETPHAQWVDAGEAVAPHNRWTRYLPCLPDEPCRPDGTAQVRGPDIMHFCPRGKTWMDSAPRGRCPVWSSGAWRYALAQAMPVLRQLELRVPEKPIISTAHGTRLT